MSTVAVELRGAAGRVRSGLAALWGALLIGATGQIVFAAIGFVAAIPFLIRLQRKFRTWRAPAIALVVFAGAFSLSSFVIGPALSSGSESSPAPRPGVEQPTGHYAHHHH